MLSQEDGTAVLLLDPLTDHGKRCAEFTLHVSSYVMGVVNLLDAINEG